MKRIVRSVNVDQVQPTVPQCSVSLVKLVRLRLTLYPKKTAIVKGPKTKRMAMICFSLVLLAIISGCVTFVSGQTTRTHLTQQLGKPYYQISLPNGSTRIRWIRTGLIALSDSDVITGRCGHVWPETFCDCEFGPDNILKSWRAVPSGVELKSDQLFQQNGEGPLDTHVEYADDQLFHQNGEVLIRLIGWPALTYVWIPWDESNTSGCVISINDYQRIKAAKGVVNVFTIINGGKAVWNAYSSAGDITHLQVENERVKTVTFFLIKPQALTSSIKD